MRGAVRYWVVGLCAVTAGCALRVGGGGPQERKVVALEATATGTVAEAAELIRTAGADVVLFSAPADTGWVAELARRTALHVSRHAAVEGRRLGFLARAPALGDTTVTLTVADAAPLVVHDALYEVPGDRHLDLLSFHLGAGTPLRPAVRSLLEYVATDVMADAAVVMAAYVPSAAVGDSLAALLSPAFTDARACAEGGRAGDARVLLFHGPEMRMSCRSARMLPAAIEARLIIDGR